MSQVNGLVADCAQSAASCDMWSEANPTCAACVDPAPDGGPGENSGAFLVDAVGQAYLNVAGCVQLVDGNTSCAAPLQELTLCELDACDSVACQSANPTDINNCLTAADSLACSTQVTAADNACLGADSADGGALTVCDESTMAGQVAIIYEICGNGQ